jgi:4-hydroxymandelate oxidase
VLNALKRALNLDDYEAFAREHLDPPLFAHLDGGAGDERTLRANRAAWEALTLRPRVLVGVDGVTTATTVLGRTVKAPILAAPLGFQELVARGGAAATMRGAARAGAGAVAPTISCATPAELAAAAGGLHWFQLYCFRDRGITNELIAQAAAARYDALVVTVDGPVLGRRERALRAGWEAPTDLLVTATGLTADALNGLVDPGLSWRDLEWLASFGLPLVLKGVLTREDARLAAGHGVSAVIVSNHGGRQLDGVAASAEALPEVVDAVAARLEVLVDGGVRRGIDIAAALALGARAVLVGRPVLWALAAAGEDGVAAALTLLREELATALALLGCRSPEDVTPAHVAWRLRPPAPLPVRSDTP